MNLNKANILIASGFAAPYGGNFVSMLKLLAEKLKNEYNCNIIFVFPKQDTKQWLQELQEEYIVCYTQKLYKSTTKEFIKFINEFNINLIHTHFEVYDIPVSKAISKCRKNIKMVWHLHDHLTLEKKNLSFSFLRKLKTHFSYWLQYGYYGSRAYFIGVSAEVTHLATHYREHFFSFPKKFAIEGSQNATYNRASVILNGIDLSRIKENTSIFNNSIIRFFSVGGESYSKGIATIFKAAEILEKKNHKFEVIITKGYTTEKLLSEYFKEKRPNWLKVVHQTNDVSSLFSNADIYISSSFCETMSMCVAEASISGLPIIQSDIPGTYWNSDTPSSYLFKVGDSNELAYKMEELINTDKSLLKEQCRISSKINKGRLNINNWCKEIIYIYENI